MKSLRTAIVWLAVFGATALGGCASSGELTTSKSGSADLSAKLADVAIRTDILVTKAGADVPTAITRTNQIAFFDPETREMLNLPDGNGGTMSVIRSWSYDSTDTLLMRTLPSVLANLTTVVGQGTYGLKMGRQAARLNAECVKAGTCLQGPSTVVNAVSGSSSNGQAQIDGVTLQTLINLGCAATGNCTPAVPNGPPTPTPTTTPSGGN